MDATRPPVAEELTPAPDPWDAARRLAHRPWPLFLDSAEPHPARGRYSYLAADPARTLTHPGVAADPFAALADLLPREPTPMLPGLPPFQGGVAGLFGYELGRCVERLPPPRHDEFRLSHLAVGVYDRLVAWDHAAGRCWLIARDPAGLRDLRAALAAPAPAAFAATPADRVAPVPQHPLPGWPGVTSTFDRAGYLEAVRRAVEYVHAGDCFQVNLAQRLLAPLTEHPLALYDRLRSRNPAPFAAYFDPGPFQVLSASPERFVRVSASGDVEARPIKGTRPRGPTPEADARAAAELAASPKDRAENVMIVDLLRNDLGRVCAYGSVRVPQVCEIESYRYVHHLVSAVTGRLRPGATAVDLLRASFPGGSVTGAPKVRAMEIIAELEPTARGPYCGGLGWLGFDGSADVNILIRTFTAAGGWVQFPVGGGVVADSDPAAEYDETLHKAAGLLRALAP